MGSTFNSFKFDLVSIILIFFLISRVIIDRSGLGGIIGIMVVGVFLLFVIYKQKMPKFLISMALIFTLLILYGFLNAYYLYNQPLYSMRGVIRYFTYFAIFIFAYYSKLSSRSLYNIYTVIVVAQSALATYQVLFLGMERPPGTFINSNHFSYFLIPYFSLTLFVYNKYFIAAFVFLLSAFLGGMGGVICLLLILLVYFAQYSSKKQKKWAIVLFPLLLFASAYLMQDRLKELEDITTVSDRIDAERGGGGSSLVWRIVTWNLMFDELTDKNGVYTGLGLEYASLASPYFLQSSIREPHNDYLRVLLELGVFGLIVFVFIIYYVLRNFLRIAKMLNSKLYFSIYASILALSIGLIVGNIIVLSTLFWFLLTIIGVARREEVDYRHVIG